MSPDHAADRRLVRHHGAGALYRATGVVLENLAGLPQDILQLAYAVLTVVAAFLTFWKLT